MSRGGECQHQGLFGEAHQAAQASIASVLMTRLKAEVKVKL